LECATLLAASESDAMTVTTAMRFIETPISVG
jgi:hypothetical protein